MSKRKALIILISVMISFGSYSSIFADEYILDSKQNENADGRVGPDAEVVAILVAYF